MQFDIRRFDVYRKIPKDLTQPTKIGGVISIFCILIISFLVISEFYSFIVPEVSSQLFVHNSDENTNKKIPVKLDISVLNVECRFLGLDIQDDMGRHEVGFIGDTYKNEINDGKGCSMKVSFNISKVPGNFHVSTHASHEQPINVNMAHEIHELTIGNHVEHLSSLPDSSFNSLNGVSQLDKDASSSHDYIMKIVPTIYQNINNEVVLPYQYTYAYRSYVQYVHSGYVAPSTIWFRYDFNPITVKYIEKRRPFYIFLIMMASAVGGVFTVAGIVDSIVFTASEIFKKHQIGKLG